LGSFFAADVYQSQVRRLSYETGAGLIADIADGIQALHDHDLVHEDLKPGNILLFSNETSPSGLIAKIADFGFAGMVTYTRNGQRGPLPDGRPRGGTAEWNAPECLKDSDPFTKSSSLDHPQYKPSRDIYSFGLLIVYIALDGQSPKQYVKDVTEAKFSGKMIEASLRQISQHYETDHEMNMDHTLKGPAFGIVHKTLLLESEKRAKAVKDLEVRKMLFNEAYATRLNDKTSANHNSRAIIPYRSIENFILDFELYPKSAHEFQCSGLYDSYRSCPHEFQARVYNCFRKLSAGPFGQYVEPGIWEMLKVEEQGSDVGFPSSQTLG
jgi:serine/threonine protein kinase